MVYVKVRVGKKVVFNKPIREVQYCSLNVGAEERHIITLWYNTSFDPQCVYARLRSDQRISFYDNGKLVSEINIKRGTTNDDLYTLFDDKILPYYNHAKALDAVDKLK